MLIDRLLLTAEGDEGGAGAGDAGTDTSKTDAGAAGEGDKGKSAGDAGTNGKDAAWYAPAEVLKSTDPEIWESFEKSIASGGHKDMAGLVKHTVSLEKRLGSAVTIPAKDAKAEDIAKWTKDVGEKIKSRGLAVVKAQEAPPVAADMYDIKLDAIPEPLRSESTVKSLREWAFGYGLSNKAVGELIDIEAKRYTEAVKPVLEIDRKKSQDAFDAWASSTGKESKALQAYGGAWLVKNMSETEMQRLEDAGLADHPALLKLVAQAGMDTGEDISEIDGTAGPDLDTEFNEVLRMTSDPKHPDYKLWMSGNTQDPKRQALQDKYNAAFKHKYGIGEAK